MSEIDKTEEERIEEAKQEAIKEAEAKAKAAQDAMTAELQAERQRRQAAEEEMKRAKEEHSRTPETDPEKVFTELLNKKSQEEAKSNKEEAIKSFKNSVREFSDEHDTAGIVFSAFERELNKFNLEGLKTKEDFTNRFKEVYEFMNRAKKPTDPNVNFYKGGTSNTGSDPAGDDKAHLSDVEKNLIKDMGWTNERYLAQKAKRPHYISSLLQYRSQ